MIWRINAVASWLPCRYDTLINAVNFGGEMAAMSFVRGVGKINEQEAALWFVLQGQRLLVAPCASGVSVPSGRQLFNRQPPRANAHFLGWINGQPCVGAESDGIDGLPAHLQYLRLRDLFGQLPDDVFEAAGLAMQLLGWEHAHQYCGRCGESLQLKSDEHAKICRACDLVVYPRINPCVIVAVVRRDRLLLVQRQAATHTRYSVVAGYVEAGESLEACVHREVLEETGVSIKHLRYFGSQPWPYSGALMAAFTAEYDNGEIKANSAEIADAGWFRAGSLPPIPGWGSIARQLIDWFVAKAGQSSA